MPTRSVWKAQKDQGGHFSANGIHPLNSPVSCFIRETDHSEEADILGKSDVSQSSVFMSFKVLDFSLMGLCGSAWTGRNPPQKKKKKTNRNKNHFTAVIRSPASLRIPSTTDLGQSQHFLSYFCDPKKLVIKMGNCSHFSK